MTVELFTLQRYYTYRQSWPSEIRHQLPLFADSRPSLSFRLP